MAICIATRWLLGTSSNDPAMFADHPRLASMELEIFSEQDGDALFAMLPGQLTAGRGYWCVPMVIADDW